MPKPPHTRSAHDLDVRPVLARGGDPFSLVIDTAGALLPSQTLHVLLDFDPATLCATMRSLGWSAHSKHSGGVFHVWLERAQSPERHPPLQAPVPLDVRNLALPVIAILEKLVELGPEAQLFVRDKREPTLLYDKLALRGYHARAERRGDDDYVIHVAPAWVFEGR